MDKVTSDEKHGNDVPELADDYLVKSRRGIRRFIPHSIRGVLILLLLTMIIPSALSEVSHYNELLEGRREQEFQHNLELARVIAKSFDSFVENILHQEFVIGNAITSPQAFSKDQIYQLLYSSTVGQPSVRYYAWMTPQGRIVTSSDVSTIGKDMSDSSFFSQGSIQQSWYMSNVFEHGANGQPAFDIFRSIYDPEGKVLGVVAAEIDPSALGDVLKFDRAGQVAYLILDRNGFSVYRFPEVPMTFNQRNLVATQPIIRDALGGKEVSGTISAINGTFRMASYTPTHSLGWVATASREEGEAMAPIFDELFRESGMEAFVFGLIILVASIIGLYITIPTNRLRDQALAFAQGRFSHRIRPGGPTELAELASTLNRMAHEIELRDEANRNATDALKQARNELETRVNERTAELSRANEGLQVEIAERKKAEEALRDSEEKYRTLFVLASDALLTVVPGTGNIIEANEAALEMLGYSAHEIQELTGKNIIASEVYEETTHQWTEQIRTNGYFLVETNWIRKDGSQIAVEVGGKPFELGGRTLMQLIGRDVSERKRMEEELRRAQRLETAGRIAGQVAHDFNNLLSPLVGYPDLIKMELPENHSITRYCDAMLNAAEQMADINEDLLTLSRRGHFNQELINVNKLVEQAVANISPKPPALSINLNLAPDLLPVNGSGAQLLRVITNLLSNGREAMLDVGILAIDTENVYVDEPTGRYNKVDIGEYVRLRVADTGCGVPEEIKDKIFDPFYTTKRTDRKRGSGLGLSVVQVIVEDHKGFIDLDSEVGEGTTFSIYLPISRESAGVLPNAEIRGGAESILVVDDDGLQREIINQLLQKLGYRVTMAASGEEAIKYLQNNQIDLLILDMIMPDGVDGAETYRQALGIKPGQRAIILSGFAESERVREAQTLGAGGYVRKPVTIAKLAQAVRTELDRDSQTFAEGIPSAGADKLT